MSTRFSTRFVVAPDDIDALGHASNIAYVRWIQDAAVAHSTALGYSLDDYMKMGLLFVVRRHEIDYLRAVQEGEELVATTWLSLCMAAKCQRETTIARASNGELVAKASTLWGCIDRERGRPTRVPKDVKAALLAGNGSAPHLIS